MSHIKHPVSHDGTEAYQDDCFCCRGLEIARLRARVVKLAETVQRLESQLQVAKYAHAVIAYSLAEVNRIHNQEMNRMSEQLQARNGRVAELETIQEKHGPVVDAADLKADECGCECRAQAIVEASK